MNDEPSVNPSAVPDEPDTDVVSLLKAMQQQLHSLEQKMDLLISQSKERPSGGKISPDRPFRKRSFSKPFRSFDHSQRHGKGEHAHGARERDTAQGHFYEHRPGEKSRSTGPKKKPFSFKRKDRE